MGKIILHLNVSLDGVNSDSEKWARVCKNPSAHVSGYFKYAIVHWTML
jgi:hypothetical protein